MSLINSFTHFQENWKFVIICVQDQWELCTHDMVQLPTCEGDIRISQNLMKTLKIISLERIIQYCQFVTVWFLKIFCIKWIHTFSEYSVLLSPPHANTNQLKFDLTWQISVVRLYVQCPSTPFRLSLTNQTVVATDAACLISWNWALRFKSTQWNPACSRNVSHSSGITLMCGGL